MTELELKLPLPDQIANQSKAAGLLASEAIEWMLWRHFLECRQAVRSMALAVLYKI